MLPIIAGIWLLRKSFSKKVFPRPNRFGEITLWRGDDKTLPRVAKASSGIELLGWGIVDKHLQILLWIPVNQFQPSMQ